VSDRYVKKSTNIVWSRGKVTYKDRCHRLGQKGLVVWFTGLSGAGKSTIAIEVEKELMKLGRVVYRLDGDNIRHGLCSNLGFSVEDRNENVRRIAEAAALFKDSGLIILVSCISPIKEMREFARQKVNNGDFIEVYVKADIETCIKRDTKGLYKRAQEGEIIDFTGISSAYEEGESVDLIIDTDILTVKESVAKVLDFIVKEVCISCQ
jgi:adenylylsulfate kinase